MRELLDTPTQRRLKILEILNEVSDWISSNELAQQNNASLRTINNDVSYLKDNWHPLLLIETSKKNGVRLRTQASSHVEFVYRYVLKNSEAFRLLESMFFDTTLSIEKWGEKLFISESSLYRITNAMSNALKKYGLVLEKKPCRIIGENEFFVRCFYTSFFREAYNITEWPFPVDKRLSFDYIQSVLDVVDFDLDENQINHINYLFNVCLVRQSQSFYVDQTLSFDNQEAIQNMLLNDKERLNKIAQTYKVKVDERLLKDVMYSIFYHQANWKDSNEEVLIKREIGYFIKHIRDVFDIKLSNPISHKIESTMIYLYQYHQLYPYRNYIIFDEYFYNGTVIKNNYPVFDSIVTQALTKLEKNTKFPWETEYHNVVLYLLMIKWHDLPEILEDKKEKASILILSNLGQDHGNFLAKRINNNFGLKATIDTFSGSISFLEEEPKELFDAYDILITNFNTDLLPNEKLVVIDDIPSGNDWGTIRKNINNINKIDVNNLEHLNSQ